MTDLPLLREACLDAPFARRRGGAITVRRFLADVAALAALLPDQGEVANLCQDRYRFAVGFAAALCRGQLTLLPPSESAGQLDVVLGGRRGVYCLADGDHPVPVPVFRYPELGGGGLMGAVPAFPAGQMAAVLYTSGSTGTPQPHPRSWGLLVESAISAGRAIGADRMRGGSLIGTVPHQHSYGLESLIMLGLMHGLVLHAERPFYAHDIVAQLEAAPMPRVLATTPVHLRVLLAEPVLPPVSLVLSATAPLPVALAAAAEAGFAAPVREIYGCSEVGQLAARRTTEGDEWRCLDGFSLRQRGAGTFVSGVCAGGGVAETRLGDIIELTDAVRFRLLGRDGDLVNIAGKRSSLMALNAQLSAIEGVEDAAFVMEEDVGDGPARLVAFVVAPGRGRAEILAALRLVLDPAFLPRRLYLMPSLPRNTLGKLTRESVTALLERSELGKAGS